MPAKLIKAPTQEMKDACASWLHLKQAKEARKAKKEKEAKEKAERAKNVHIPKKLK